MSEIVYPMESIEKIQWWYKVGGKIVWIVLMLLYPQIGPVLLGELKEAWECVSKGMV